MTILIFFFAGLFALVALFVVVILLAGFRPQKHRRSGGGLGNSGIRDSGGGTTP